MIEVKWDDENKKIEDFLNIIPEPLHKIIPYGILLTADSSHFISSVLLLKQLQFLNNTLPIEYYYYGDELFPFQIEFIQSHFPNVQLFNCMDLIPLWFPWKIEEKHIKGFMIKSFCMMVSKIKNILFIDPDNIPFIPIEELFQNNYFIQHQNIFWYDIELSTNEEQNLISKDNNKNYQYLNVNLTLTKNILPIESGQILMNTHFCWKAICLTYYFKYFFHIYDSFFQYDKELFFVAFQKTNTFYYINEFKPFICYHKNHEFGKLSSIFHRDPSSGKPIFLHHIKSKISINQDNSLQFIYPTYYPLLNEKNNLSDFYYDFNHHLNTTFVLSIFKKLNMNELQNLIKILNLKFNHIIIFVQNIEIKNIIYKMINTGKLLSKIDIILIPFHEIQSLFSKSQYYFSNLNQHMSDDIMNQHLFFDLFQYIENNHIKTNSYLIFYSLSKKNIDLLQEPFFRLSESSIDTLNFKCGLFEDHLNELIILPTEKISYYFHLYHQYFIQLKPSQLLQDPSSIFKDFISQHLSEFTLFKNDLKSPSELNILHDYSLKYQNNIPSYVSTFYHDVYYPFIKIMKDLYHDPQKLDSFKNHATHLITESKKKLFQNNLIINEKKYQLSIEFMNQFMNPIDPFFILSQFEFELYQNNKSSIYILFEIILNNNYHNTYKDIREIILKYIHCIYEKNTFSKFMSYFDDIYFFNLVIRLQCFNTISLNECIEFLKNRIHHPFIFDMISIFENIKNKDILLEKINIVINSIQTKKYGELNFIRPFYFNQFYFLTYQNQNNCIIRKKVSQLHQLLFPSIHYLADFSKYKEPKQLPSNQFEINKNRIKVGFISFFFKSHSVGRDRIGIIRGLNPDLFDIHIFHFDNIEGDFYRSLCFQSNIHNHFMLYSSLEEYRNHIEKQKLDILVYADIGMIEETYLLAHSRLAPIQINTIGHSETSGIDTIDYYVSSILYDDLEESFTHYSEKLVLTNSLNTFYYRDFYNLYENSNVNKDYILPLSPDKIYLSYLQNSLKADIEDLQLLYQILDKIPSINIVLINLIENSLEDDKMKKHLKPFFEQNRVILLPKLSTNHFYTLIQKSYLLLDAYPHGGCNTSLESFHFGKIMVSRPSPFLRGRFTKGFYQKMGITDCIVQTPEEYIEKIQYFVNHPEKKLEVEEKIKKQSHLLFHDYQSIVDWNYMFLQLHQK